MIPVTLSDIATIIGGTLHLPSADEQHRPVDKSALFQGSVEFDSRQVGEGDLFMCIPGARVDGHDYAERAYQQGACAVVATRPVASHIPTILVTPSAQRKHTNATALEHDTDGSVQAILEAFARLAHYSVGRLVNDHHLRVVGVTGSSGKTSTKDLLAEVLRAGGYEVVTPQGSFNNELGFPWTALRATPQTDILLLEISARGEGHIAELCSIVTPQVGIELNVGHAHVGEFGSQEAIARAKGELVQALPSAAEGGVAVLNSDDPYVRAMSSHTDATVLFYGREEGADYRATDVTLDDQCRAHYTLQVEGESYPVSLAVAGEHNVLNSLAVIAAAHHCGMSYESATHALATATIVSGKRMEMTTRPDGVTIINDSYNANPDSMKAALAALGSMSGSDRTSWAVLGTMGELGQISVQAHKDIALAISQNTIHHLVAVGETPEMRALVEDALDYGVSAFHAHNKDDALRYVREHLTVGDVILVKASQAERLWTIADALLSDKDNEQEEN